MRGSLVALPGGRSPGTFPAHATPAMLDLFKRKTDDAAPKRSWTERLTGGLAASRERLAGALAGVSGR